MLRVPLLLSRQYNCLSGSAEVGQPSHIIYMVASGILVGLRAMESDPEWNYIYLALVENSSSYKG